MSDTMNNSTNSISTSGCDSDDSKTWESLDYKLNEVTVDELILTREANRSAPKHGTMTLLWL